jgi:hypothetical protein
MKWRLPTSSSRNTATTAYDTARVISSAEGRKFRLTWFDTDEVEQTTDIIAGKERSLKDEIAQQPNDELKAELQRQLASLERLLERVNEACVMF